MAGPCKDASYNLVPSDIEAVLAEQNIESPVGTLGENSGNTFQYTLKYRGRYSTPEEFGDLVIKALPSGDVLYLSDVAEIELGAYSYNYSSKIGTHPGTTCMISQTSGSNANEIISEIDKVMEDIVKDLPEGIAIQDLMSTDDFLDASVNEVLKTLIEAILLVILVVYLFLQSVRSTVIPSISVIVSLVGTFAFISLMGFSLNLITLFALVLVIGTVVDDAIVVVEAVQARFDSGEKSPYKATVSAMDGISAAIVTTSLVFMAVFIPTSFIGGTSGTFYKEFGLTMAAAVGISALNALTLSPALCALLMTPHGEGKDGKATFSTRFHIAFETVFKRIVDKYSVGVQYLFKRKWIAITAVLTAIVLLVVLLKTTSTGLVPDEDMGTIFVNVTTPPGSSLEQTERTMDMVAGRLESIPQIEQFSNVTGYSMLGGGAPSGGMIIVKLKDWSLRKGKCDGIDEVIQRIHELTSDINSGTVFAFAQPTIMGYGVGNGFELYVQDRSGSDIEQLKSVASDFIVALNEREEIGMAYTSFDTKFPQYQVEVDAARCKVYGVSPSDVLSVLSGYVGGTYSSNFNRFSKLYKVVCQAGVSDRLDRESLNSMFVRTAEGKMAPLSTFVKLTKVYGAETLTRFNLYTSIAVNGSAAPGFSNSEAIAAIKETARKTLPVGYGFEFGGMSREEASTDNTVLMFVLCILFIYLILCALYESLFVPLAVMFAVPFGLAGSFLAARMCGIENNIYMQVGLIMLIGLLSKTAILLTEYASARRNAGMGIAEALANAADYTRSLMKYGTLNYLEVLSADSSLLQARIDQVSDNYDYIQGIISLYHSLGGGTE